MLVIVINGQLVVCIHRQSCTFVFAKLADDIMSVVGYFSFRPSHQLHTDEIQNQLYSDQTYNKFLDEITIMLLECASLDVPKRVPSDLGASKKLIL